MSAVDDPGSADEWPVVLISALEHFSYCPRQCALIHVEQTYTENLYTLRGRLAHERVHESGTTSRPNQQVVRRMRLWSERLGLTGQADLVEFGPGGPYPVEFKVGRVQGPHAAVQLCAQALCLEEMLAVAVPAGAIYSHATHRRVEVRFDAELRSATEAAVRAVREQLSVQRLPPAPNDARCRRCSLRDACLPEVVAAASRLRGLQGALFRVEDRLDGA